MTSFADLPADHPLRTTPLVAVGAYFIYRGDKAKHRIKPTWRIAQSTFNDLGPAWLNNADWYALDTPSTVA